MTGVQTCALPICLDRGKDAGAGTEAASGFDAALAAGEAAEETVLPLLALLKEVQKLPGIERIRLGSLEPRIMTEAFAAELAKLSKLCPHFHLSLQSGCDATLRRMNRKYTTAEYREAVGRLRRHFELPAVTTDIIVGFPGETKEEFGETIRFAKEIGFSKIHIFKYSRRAGTAADRMEAQIPEPVKAQRSAELSELESELEEEYRRNFLGAVEPVLFEEEIRIDGKRYLTGHTTRYLKVALPVDGQYVLQPNETAAVRLSAVRIKDSVVAELAAPKG